MIIYAGIFSGNVFLRFIPVGFVKILDFCISKLTENNGKALVDQAVKAIHVQTIDR